MDRVTDQTAPPGGARLDAAHARPLGGAAFQLGWLLADLCGPLLHRGGAPRPGLPGLEDLASAERVPLALEQVDGELARIAPVLRVELSTDDLRRAWADQRGFVGAVRELYLALLARLLVDEPRLASAFNLGRYLHDLCWGTLSVGDFAAAFGPRQAVLATSWLQDADPLLAPGAAAAVAASLARWRERFAAGPGAVAGGDIVGDDVESLRAQGEVWRSVLAGEKPVGRLAGRAHLAEAARGALRRSAAVVREVALRSAAELAVLGALTGYLLYVAASDAAGAARVLASLLVALVGFGAMGRLVAGRTRRLGTSLWAIDEADAWAAAITVLPGRRPAPPSRPVPRAEVRERPVAGEDAPTLPIAFGPRDDPGAHG
ncbi:MAG TPA: hypothetical protein VKV23_10500 [Acidimicrobiales bacterium]|jgi:hypothetical protein|nr:hypothetical protein [Acidimicrobiales bacterium]